MSNQSINCSVSSCKYNSEQCMCSLHDIQVGPKNSMANDKKETECDSFECK